MGSPGDVVEHLRENHLAFHREGWLRDSGKGSGLLLFGLVGGVGAERVLEFCKSGEAEFPAKAEHRGWGVGDYPGKFLNAHLAGF